MKNAMKKVLSSLLISAMLLSLCFAIAPPVSAVDGIWEAWGTAMEYADDFDGIPVSRPGYEYTEEGLHMVPANWENQTPFGTLQTKNKIDLKDGVYMLVRVDNFTYKGEKWFNFNVWDSAIVSPGSKDFGEGAQCHIRPGDAKNVGGVDWYTGGFTNVGTTVIPKTAVSMDEEGRVILALTITWKDSTYAVDVNGAPAPESVITYMNERWGGADCEAYIGFSLQNSNKNGTVEATILKFGTSKATATTPMGDDAKAPENFNHIPAEIKDASTVPAGQPSVFMNGSIVESHIMSKPVSLVGASLSVNDDYSVHVVVNKATADAGQWTVKYDVSYSVEDFPVCVALTRNLCTCRDEVCYGMESCNMYLCTGEAIQPAPECLIKYLDMPDTPFTVGDDTYLMFYIDMSDPYAPFKATGRINSVRVDFEDIDTQTPDKNAFDVCWIAFFRNVDEAEEYVMEYLGITETDKNPAKETEGKTPTDTETPAGVDATEGKQNENPVESESIPAGEKQTESKTDAPSRGGCGSVIGFGTITVIALASAMGTVSFRKKKD